MAKVDVFFNDSRIGGKLKKDVCKCRGLAIDKCINWAWLCFSRIHSNTLMPTFVSDECTSSIYPAKCFSAPPKPIEGGKWAIKAFVRSCK